MPPTTKPQTKKAEEGKEKKKAVAVAALLLLLVAAFVAAQNTPTATPTGGRTGNMTADTALSGFKDIAKWVVIGVRTVIAMAFWVAFAVVVAHFALGKVSPTRFQRMGSFWDGLERAKDIIYGYAWLFLLILAIYTVIGIVGNDNRLGPDTVGTVVKWIMIDPLVELYNELQGGQGTGQRAGQ